MSHQKQLSNDSSFVSYEVKEEGDFPLRSYSHELESHMVAPGTVIAERMHSWINFADLNRMFTRKLHAYPYSPTKHRSL